MHFGTFRPSRLENLGFEISPIFTLAKGSSSLAYQALTEKSSKPGKPKFRAFWAKFTPFSVATYSPLSDTLS